MVKSMDWLSLTFETLLETGKKIKVEETEPWWQAIKLMRLGVTNRIIVVKSNLKPQCDR